MAITKRPQKSTPAAVDAFIGQAPDAGAAPGAAAAAAPEKKARKLTRKGNKVQIALTISEPLLERLEARAVELGQTRAGLINLAIVQLLDEGVNLGSE